VRRASQSGQTHGAAMLGNRKGAKMCLDATRAGTGGTPNRHKNQAVTEPGLHASLQVGHLRTQLGALLVDFIMRNMHCAWVVDVPRQHHDT
jgi:hypothetical protein